MDDFKEAANTDTIGDMPAVEEITLVMSDGYEVRCRWWPARAGGAVAVYLHGIQSHGGWYVGSASRLAEAGVGVLLPDRRGCGWNSMGRGHSVSARRLVRDVLEEARWARARASTKRVHLVGVSWGGKLALAAHQAAPDDACSLTLIAPGLFSKVNLPVRMRLAVALARVVTPRRHFDLPLDDPELFTGNPERIEFIRKDPLRLRTATAGLLVASRFLDRATRRARRGPATVMNLFLAEKDRIIDNERTKAWARDLPGSERRIIEYRGAHHTLEFEPEPCRFIDDLVAAVGN